jgi:CheY-like chemotaxis protein
MSKILVVDDNGLNLRLACDTLELAGHETLSAVNGKEGVDIAVSECPDLILMDLRMPVMNGEEAMEKIKADVRAHDIPVVALTASAMTGEREQLLAMGFDGYISKPIDITSFAGEVASLLPDMT